MAKEKTTKKKPTKKPVEHEIELDVVGLQHRITTSTRRWLALGIEKDGPIFCRLVREPENQYDENAIKVVIQEGNYKDLHVGYIQRSVASVLALMMDDDLITDVLVALLGIDVDAGTADARLQFTAPSKMKFPKRKG